MKKYTSAGIIPIMILLSLATSFSQESVFEIDLENQKKLPALSVYIDNEKLATAYLHREVLTAREYEGGELSGRMESSIFFEDKKILDAMNLFEHYLEEELMDQSPDDEGEIEIEVVYYDYDHNVSPFLYFNTFSFGVGALLGLPNFSGKTIVEIDLTIYDNAFERIARYSSIGKHRYFQGLYYNRKLDQRESNLRALKDALAKINEQVMEDYDEIMGEITR